MLPAAPPLVPTPDEARSSLRRELLGPDYRPDDLLATVLDWLRRALDDALGLAQGASAASTLVALLLLLVLVGALVLLVSRLRRTASTRRRPGAVLGGADADADALRARALAALAEGHHDRAAVDGFRALARRGVEQGLIADDPGATAREVARAIGAPDGTGRRAAVLEAADLVDGVLYGARVASYDEAAAVLALDDTPVVAR